MGPKRALLITLAVLLTIGAVALVWALGREPAPPPAPVEVRDAGIDVAAPKDAAVDGDVEPRETIDDALPESLDEQRARLLRRIEAWYAPTPAAMNAVREIFGASKLLGQGNPAASEHPMTRSECLQKQKRVAGDPRCGSRNMVPLYNPGKGETAASARVCIDQYEFPNIACEYPVVYAKANEAAALCEALGKRICDAHEWEGACAGALLEPDQEYHWGERRLLQSHLHNEKREKVWAYGPKKNHALCATASRKSKKCTAGGWRECGSNTYPAGAFVECVSRFGVYDLHGNAAEHMNLAVKPEELASRGGSGMTEMKGSWFIFLRGEAHEDDCRWRAPPWHDSRLRDAESHRNYHLGFRCCKNIAAAR